MSFLMLHFSCYQLCSFIIPCAWDAFWQKFSFSSKGWELHVLLHSTQMSINWATNAHSVFASFLLPLTQPSQHLGTPTYFQNCPYTINKMSVEFWFQTHLIAPLNAMWCPGEAEHKLKLGGLWMVLEPPRWRSLPSTSLLIPLENELPSAPLIPNTSTV